MMLTLRSQSSWALLFFLSLAWRVGAQTSAPAFGPARWYPETVLIQNGQPAAVVVASSSDSNAAAAAGQVAQKLQAKYGVRFAIVADINVCPERLGPVATNYQAVNLIAVGNLYCNRVFFPLYAQYLCGASSAYPGGDGYELRTVCNPWGTGKNVIIVGGSSYVGMQAGMEAILKKLPELKNGTATLPYTIDVKPGGVMMGLFANTADRLANATEPDIKKYYGTEAFYTPAQQYYWTGNPRGAEVARNYLIGYFNATFKTQYPFAHYADMESLYRAWDMVEESPVFTDEERQTIARHMAETALNQRQGVPSGAVPIAVGSTHNSGPMMDRWAASRYLERTFQDSPELLKLCDTWEKGVANYFQGAFAGFRDDTDDSGSTCGSLAMFMRWSAAEQQYDFFSSGHARVGVQYAVNVNDALGYDAGLDTYVGARIGAMYSQYLGPLFHLQLAAFIYQDPEMMWLVRHVPNRSLELYAHSYFRFDAGSFSPDPKADEKQPMYLSGFSIVPLGERRHKVFVECEKGVLPPEEQCFDKACFRSGFDTQDTYLLLQGLQAEYGDGNTIPRYTDKGKLWLVHNTSQIGHYSRNGLFLSNGQNDAQFQRACRLDAAGRFKDYSMSSSTLCDYYGTDWQRAIFWRTGEWFVVLDRATVNKPGFYSGQSVWRLPVGGEWRDDRTLQAVEDDKIFRIISSAAVPATARFERPAGGPPDVYETPFFLRESKSGSFKAGEVLDFQNLLSVAQTDIPSPYLPIRINDSAVLVRSKDGQDALVGIGGEGCAALGIKADKGMYIADGAAIYVAGVGKLSVSGRMILNSEKPVTGRIDLKTGVMTSGYDAAQLKAAAFTWRLPDTTSSPLLEEKQAAAAAGEIAAEIMKVKDVPARVAQTAARAAVPNPLSVVWENAQVGFEGRRLRGIRLSCAPPVAGRTGFVFDNILVAGAGTISWQPGVTPTIELAWPAVETLNEIRLNMAPIGRNDVETAQALNEEREIGITWSNDGFQKDLRTEKRMVKSGYRVDPTYKNEITVQKVLHIPAKDVKASAVRLILPPAGKDGNARVILSEIEVIAADRGPLAIHHLISADLENDGRREWIINADEGVLSVVDQDGKLKWQKNFVAEVSGVAVGDLKGDGRQEVFASCYDLNVYAFSDDGSLLWKTSFQNLDERTGKKFDSPSTPFGVGFWDFGNGFRRVLVGGYSCQTFLLDEKGVIFEEYPLGGMFQRTFVPETVDLNGDGIQDKLMSCIRYGAFGTIYSIIGNAGGLIPPNLLSPDFPSGTGHRSTWIPDGLPYVVELAGKKRSLACIITPVGYGVYDLAQNFPEQKRSVVNTVWEIKGGRPISAGLLYDTDGDGQKEFIVAGRDGFVGVLALDGKLIAKRLIGEEALGIATLGSGPEIKFFLATPQGLLVCDANWEVRGVAPGPYARVVVADSERKTVLAVTEDGRLQQLRLTK